MDDFQALLDDATETQELSEEKLGRIATYVNRMDDLNKEIVELEEALKEKKQEKNIIEMSELPDILDEVGVEGMDLPGGRKLKIAKIYGSKIQPDNKAKAMNWLVDHDLGYVVKTEIKAPFAAGDVERAKDLAAKLVDAGFEVSANQTVHAQTLKKLLKEMDEQGRFDELPMDLFGQSLMRRVQIK